jgi:hypothetical protein
MTIYRSSQHRGIPSERYPHWKRNEANYTLVRTGIGFSANVYYAEGLGYAWILVPAATNTLVRSPEKYVSEQQAINACEAALRDRGLLT